MPVVKAGRFAYNKGRKTNKGRRSEDRPQTPLTGRCWQGRSKRRTPQPQTERGESGAQGRAQWPWGARPLICRAAKL